MRQDKLETPALCFHKQGIRSHEGSNIEQINYSLQPQDCKQYLKCNAPVCPFDKRWSNRTYIKGEPVCFYLKEYAKPFVRPFLRGVIGKKQYQVIAEAYPEVVLTYYPIKTVLDRASRNPSKLVKPPKEKVA